MKTILSFCIMSLLATGIFAQARPVFKYQAVARDASNELISNGDIALQITLLEDGATEEYIENHNLIRTNEYGVFSINIGDGSVDALSPNDDLMDIDWSSQQMHIQVGMDVDLTNGISFQVLGSSELLTVPYALHAFSSENMNTDDQELTGASLSGTVLSLGIENANTVSVDLARLQDGTGTDDQNLTGATLSGTQLNIGIEGGTGSSVDLGSLRDGTGTDDQNLTGATLSGTQLSINIEGGTGSSVDLGSLRDGTGTDDQQLTFNGASKELSIEGGNAVDLSSLAGSGGTDDQQLSVNTSTNELEIEDGNSVGLNDLNYWTRLGSGNLLREGRVLIGGGSGTAWIDPNYFAIGLDGGAARYRLHKDDGLIMQHDGTRRASFKYDELKMTSANGNSEILMNGTFLQNKSNSLGTTATMFPGSFSTNGSMTIYSPAGGTNPRIDMNPDSIVMSAGGVKRMNVHHDRGINMTGPFSLATSYHDYAESGFHYDDGIFDIFSSRISSGAIRLRSEAQDGSQDYESYVEARGLYFYSDSDANSSLSSRTLSFVEDGNVVEVSASENGVSVRSDSKYSIRTVRSYGLISSNGTASGGIYTNNYTVTKTGTGRYGIQVTDWPSGTIPSVTVTIFGATPGYATWATLSSNGYFEVYTFDKNGNANDLTFNFSVFGQ